MNKLNKILFCLGLGVSLVAAPSAKEAFGGMIHPYLLGGVNNMLNTGGGLGYTAGVGLDFGLGPVLNLSVGGKYLSRAFTGSTNLNYAQIPVILRIRFFHVIQLGGGGFYDIPITSGAGNNYGVTGSLRLKPMTFPLFVEGRYNYGLSTTSFTSKTSEVQALLGVMF